MTVSRDFHKKKAVYVIKLPFVFIFPKNASDKMHRHYFKKETELKIQIEERSKKILEEEIQSKMEN